MADIDQRIEALTQSVELLAHMQRETERRHRDTERSFNEFLKISGGVMQPIAHSLDRAYDLIENHETRISKLEGNNGTV